MIMFNMSTIICVKRENESQIYSDFAHFRIITVAGEYILMETEWKGME